MLLVNDVFLKNKITKLKSEDLDEGLKASGSNHNYQFFLIIVIFFLKIVTDSFYAPLPYFLMDPKISCYNQKTKLYDTKCTLSEVCNSKVTNYKLLNQNENFSWITGFNIYCDRYKIGILASSASIGNLLSNIVGPLLTENIGRVKTLTVILIFDIIIKSTIFFSTDISIVYVILLLMNVTNNTVYNAISIYLNEMVDSNQRGKYSCMFNSLYGISGVIFTVIYNFTFNWKILQMLSIGSAVIALFLNLIFIKESIRYLYQKHKYEEIDETLEYIAKFNGREQNYSTWKEGILKRSNEENIIQNNEIIAANDKNPIKLIFKRGEVIYNFLTFCIVSLVTISGLIYNAIEIKTATDTFLFPIIFYLTDFLIILTTGFIIDLKIFGRKIPAIFFSFTGGLFYMIKYLIILKQGDSVSIFWVDYVIRLSVSVSFNILITYNLEIYSTDIRATAFNINKLFSRVGDFCLPIILTNNRSLATIIMSSSYFVMALFIFKLRETRGVKLKETVDEDYSSNKLGEDFKNCDLDKKFETVGSGSTEDEEKKLLSEKN
jgi:hypothetical protein